MPRKKTIQPAPLEVHDYGDLIVEIIDKDTRPIGRGQDKAFNANEIAHQALIKLNEMRESSSLKERERARVLLEGDRMAETLARQLHDWGYDGTDRTLRKHAKSIRREWQILRAAMEANNIDPWP